MDPLKILESIDELLYRAALWVLLLPRTLLRILSSPALITPYVTEELKKPPDQQFKELMSPVQFWALAAMVPHLMLLDLLADIPESRVATESLWGTFMKAPWSTRLVVVSVVALAGPLGFSFRCLRDRSAPINRDTLRLPFMIQCYCFTPAYLALLPIVYFALRYDTVPSGPSSWVAAAAWTFIVGWIAIAESTALAAQLAISRLTAVLRTGQYLAFVVVLLLLLELIVITIFHGLSVWRR